MYLTYWQPFATFLLSLAPQPWGAGWSGVSSCKTLPSDSDWPSHAKWAALAAEVDDQLIHYVPTGAVCSQSSGYYDAAACAELLPVYWRQSFVDKDPGLVRCFEYTNNSCDPSSDPATACTSGYYPAYVVNATKPEHVSAAVRFARDNNVRLNVKNTGHDFNGRSTARGSLSVWIANWRGIEWSDEFATSCSPIRYSAVTVTGGVQWKELYAGVATTDKVFVGGAVGTVGVLGGYLQGGGHSPISSMFGMAADNVLEFTVVKLTTGEIVKANACTNPDLFWALRGGGGGTFGIVTSATFRTFPSVQNVAVGRLNVKAASSTNIKPWIKANAHFHSQLGRVSDAGIAGHYFTINTYSMHFVHVMLNNTAAALDAIMLPLVARLQAMADVDGAGFTVTFSSRTVPWKLYATAYTTDKEMDFGFGDPTTGDRDTVLGSRLVPRSAMEADPDAYMDTLMFGLEDSTAVLGFLVAGGQVALNKNLDTAVNPAWRTALSHIVFYNDLSNAVGTDARKAARVAMTAKVAKLTALSPHSGAYLNECDVNQPDKAATLYGDNYPALHALKKRYDPHGLLWCSSCVGFADWDEVDGRLCKA